MSEGHDFVSVFSGQLTEADLIKFLLQEAGIRCWLQNETMGATLPVDAVSVLVAPEDAERARAEIKRSQEEETASD